MPISAAAKRRPSRTGAGRYRLLAARAGVRRYKGAVPVVDAGHEDVVVGVQDLEHPLDPRRVAHADRLDGGLGHQPGHRVDVGGVLGAQRALLLDPQHAVSQQQAHTARREGEQQEVAAYGRGSSPPGSVGHGEHRPTADALQRAPLTAAASETPGECYVNRIRVATPSLARHSPAPCSPLSWTKIANSLFPSERLARDRAGLGCSELVNHPPQSTQRKDARPGENSTLHIALRTL